MRQAAGASTVSLCGPCHRAELEQAGAALEHLLAALAVWDYACASVRYLFGERLADPDADTLLAELRATPEGLTRTEIVHQTFGRNKRRAEIDRTLGTLLVRQ